MVQAARDVILKADGRNEAGRHMREKMHSTQNKFKGYSTRIGSSSAQRRSFKMSKRDN